MFNQPCSLYEEFGATPENSLIAQKIKNPCAAQRILGIMAKLPAIQWQKEYTDAFDEWSNRILTAINSWISYKGLQDMVIMEISKLNAKVGMTMMVVSSGILVFDDTSPILPMDIKLIKASLVDLRAQVAQMAQVAQ